MGKKLYDLYLKTFETVFAPKWEELTETSRNNWTKLAESFVNIIAIEEI